MHTGYIASRIDSTTSPHAADMGTALSKIFTSLVPEYTEALACRWPDARSFSQVFGQHGYNRQAVIFGLVNNVE